MSNETQTMDTNFSDAVEVLLKAKRVSAELLVRKLDIKRDQAEELLKQMAVEGFVGLADDKGKRELLLTPEVWAKRKDAPAAEMPAAEAVSASADTGGAGTDAAQVNGMLLGMEAEESAVRGTFVADSTPLTPARIPVPNEILNLTKGVHDIPLCFIRESAFNPRSLFNEESLKELGETLKDSGIGQVQVVTVFRLDEPDENGCIFELENGARRYRAAKLAGVETLRCEIVKAHTKADRLVRRVIANGMSEDMNPIDKGLAFAQILADCNGDKKLAAKRAGLGERGVRVLEQSIHRVNNLIDEVKDALIAGKIPVSHADLISHRKTSEQRECLRMCFEMSVTSSAAGVTDREEVLISEKALREKLRNRFAQADEDAAGQQKMFDNAPPETEAQRLQRLEDQGTRTLEGAGSDKNGAQEVDPSDVFNTEWRQWPAVCEVCKGDIGPVRAVISCFKIEGGPKKVCIPCFDHWKNHSKYARRDPHAYCQGCNANATRRTSEGVALCRSCVAPASTPPAAAPVTAPKSNEGNDYADAKQKRISRMVRAFTTFEPSNVDSLEFAVRIARQLCPPLLNVEAFAGAFGPKIRFQRGERIVWFGDAEMGGTVREFIDWLGKDRGDSRSEQIQQLQRVILILLVMPAIEPNYSDDALRMIEGWRKDEPKTKPSASGCLLAIPPGAACRLSNA